MAKIYLSPPKYHPNEWHSSNSQNFKQSEKERISSERLRAECERLRKETEDTTRRTQRDVEHKFSQRINDINFWKEELEAKLNATVAEIGAVLDYKAQLEQALKSTSFPLEVAKSCLVFREKRVGIDLVHDEVEIQLMKEVEVIEGIQALLQKTHDETVEQIRRLRSCKYKLEKDLKDKFGAFAIDSDCVNLKDNSQEIGFSPSSVKVQANSITPDEWQLITDDNICTTEQERIASTTLRQVINSILDQTQQDMMKQRKTVNLVFHKRIQEITDAKKSLEEHLQEVIKEVAAQESNISTLQEDIHAKTAPMQLAHTRLHYRSQRPNNELVQDPVQYQLVHEVNQIDESVQQLQKHFLQAEATLKKLNRNQLVLEEDIAIKTNSLMIDADQCMALRKQMNTQE